MTTLVVMVRIYDAAVVGAGPAGLSAAAAITAAGGRCIVLEQGKGHTTRDRHAPEQILSGVGGAGLFSDGKHSFYPSATELWRLPDAAALAAAYAETRSVLARHGVDAPRPPSLPLRLPSRGDGDGDGDVASAWHLKRYPSLYASLEERMRCIADLYEQCGELPWLSARVVGAARARSGDLISLEVDQHGERRLVEARALVVATGRLSPRWLRTWLEPLGVAFAFRRLEIGVRLETLASAPLFTMLDGVDPKLSFAEKGTKLLTFCTCRDGEVVIGSAGNIDSVSGRADGPRTGRSNVGLLARITDVALAREIEPHVFASAASFRAPLTEMVRGASADARMVATFGAAGAAVVGRALERFLERFPELATDSAAIVHAPCIEGVGDYPVSNDHLEAAPGVFVAGDAGGRFRGIVASMISGRYVGSRLARR